MVKNNKYDIQDFIIRFLIIFVFIVLPYVFIKVILSAFFSDNLIIIISSIFSALVLNLIFPKW